MSKSKKNLALVKWISGEYKDTYTPGVPIEWIKDFDCEEFDPQNEDEDTSYVVEWRDNSKGKCPKSGWKCYDATIIMVASSMKSLKTHLKVIDGENSPLKIKTNLTDKKANDTNKKKLEEHLLDDSLTGKSREIPVNPERIPERIISETNETINDDDNFAYSDAEMNDNESIELSSNQSTTKDHSKLYKLLKKLSKDVRKIKHSQNQLNESRNRMTKENAMVEIGHDGSNVFVTNAQWRTAESQKSHQSMGKSLVLSLFPTQILLQSNLRGGASKININSARRSGLDKNIMSAIEEAVIEKFPGEFKRTLFGIAINNVLTDMRRKNILRAVAHQHNNM